MTNDCAEPKACLSWGRMRDMAPEWRRVLMAGAHKLRCSEKATPVMTGRCLLLILMRASGSTSSHHICCWRCCHGWHMQKSGSKGTSQHMFYLCAVQVLDTFKVAAELGPESLSAYVISMATNASDVLAVELLKREAALVVRY